MKRKFNLWILNIVLTATISFFLGAGNSGQLEKEVSPSKKGIGTLKLSGKNFAKPEYLQKNSRRRKLSLSLFP